MIEDLSTGAAAKATWFEVRGNAHGSRRTARYSLLPCARPSRPLSASGSAVIERVVAAAEPLDVGPERALVW